MKTVNEVSRQTGVSIRTLHYYDAIGLLRPTQITESGYRLYDDTALERLQNILLFRELQFPLREIREILDSPVLTEKGAGSADCTSADEEGAYRESDRPRPWNPYDRSEKFGFFGF